MLVLSRKVGEKLVIGDGIVVTINRIVGQRVSVGVEAPPHVRIVRSELAPDDAEQPSHAVAAV
ncbi:MAG TPA: carbon storage regulator [Pirellulales bacterium]|nr:carbon storage regulator [Pirellulales bacterium]